MRYITLDEGGFLKRILTYLYCTIYNEISICHSDVQKHVSYTESPKRFLIYFGLCLEMAGKVFSIGFVSIILNFNALCDACTF